MPKYLMLALNGPTKGEGDEETYNRWYNEVHVPDLESVDEVVSAKRYKVVRGNLPGMENWPYLAVYEIETDDMAKVSQKFQASLRPFDPTFDRSTSGHLLVMEMPRDDE